MKTGIFCIETEWEMARKSMRLPINSQYLIDFVQKWNNYKCTYKQVATRQELEYYIHRLSLEEYKNDYKIIYFSCHGGKEGIVLEGEPKNNKFMTLDELAQIVGDKAFNNRWIHFSSCQTLKGTFATIQDFLDTTGALAISGYTKEVDGMLSAIHDMALFEQIIKHPKHPETVVKRLSTLYEGAVKKLGFKVVY